MSIINSLDDNFSNSMFSFRRILIFLHRRWHFPLTISISWIPLWTSVVVRCWMIFFRFWRSSSENWEPYRNRVSSQCSYFRWHSINCTWANLLTLENVGKVERKSIIDIKFSSLVFNSDLLHPIRSYAGHSAQLVLCWVGVRQECDFLRLPFSHQCGTFDVVEAT